MLLLHPTEGGTTELILSGYKYSMLMRKTFILLLFLSCGNRTQPSNSTESSFLMSNSCSWLSLQESSEKKDCNLLPCKIFLKSFAPVGTNAVIEQTTLKVMILLCMMVFKPIKWDSVGLLCAGETLQHRWFDWRPVLHSQSMLLETLTSTLTFEWWILMTLVTPWVFF